MASFKELGLSEEILKVLGELGFEAPTEIQQNAIPRLLAEDKDMIGLAQTGTGKTAAFGLPLIERIDPSIEATQGLILAPTRELGKQIAEQIQVFSKYKDKVNVLVVYGGAAISNQIKALRRTQHIIIATPGRLIDLIGRRAVKLDQLRFLVLDEADEMLNMGFKEDIDEILSYAPEEKLTWLFSATMPDFIKKIVSKYMDDPIEVRIDAKNEVNKNIQHLYTVVKQRDKSEALMRFLDIHADMRGVVFCRTKRDTQELAEYLLQNNYKADALHGDLSQHQRDRVMKRFKKHDLQVLIATDVAARGIDVNDLTHVFHHSLPDDNAYYTHRSGRTARAGKKGISISFVSGREQGRITRLQRQLGIDFEKVLIPETESITEIRMTNWAMELLEKEASDTIEPKISEHIEMLFANMTKEELVAKLLTTEIEKLGVGRSRDLNDTSPARGDGGGGRDRGRGRNRGSRGGRDRGGRGGRDRGARSSRDRDRGGRGGRRDDRRDDRRRGGDDRRRGGDDRNTSGDERRNTAGDERRNTSGDERRSSGGSSRRNEDERRAKRNKKFESKVNGGRGGSPRSNDDKKGKSAFKKKKKYSNL